MSCHATPELIFVPAGPPCSKKSALPWLTEPAARTRRPQGVLASLMIRIYLNMGRIVLLTVCQVIRYKHGLYFKKSHSLASLGKHFCFGFNTKCSENLTKEAEF